MIFIQWTGSFTFMAGLIAMASQTGNHWSLPATLLGAVTVILAHIAIMHEDLARKIGAKR